MRDKESLPKFVVIDEGDGAGKWVPLDDVLGKLPFAAAMERMTQGFKASPDLIRGWHANLTMMSVDAGAPHLEASLQAATFMTNAWGVDPRECDWWELPKVLKPQRTFMKRLEAYELISPQLDQLHISDLMSLMSCAMLVLKQVYCDDELIRWDTTSTEVAEILTVISDWAGNGASAHDNWEEMTEMVWERLHATRHERYVLEEEPDDESVH